jgi:hypothetical protein
MSPIAGRKCFVTCGQSAERLSEVIRKMTRAPHSADIACVALSSQLCSFYAIRYIFGATNS